MWRCVGLAPVAQRVYRLFSLVCISTLINWIVIYLMDTVIHPLNYWTLMVSGLDSGSNSPGSSLNQEAALCSWARHFTLIFMPLFTQVYKCVISKFNGVRVEIIFLVPSCEGNQHNFHLNIWARCSKCFKVGVSN